MPVPIERLAEFTSRQYGCFTRAQALSVGISASALERRVARGEWLAVDHGVYRTALTPVTWHQRVLAACLAGPAVASHRTAAALWSVPGFEFTTVEVTARRHRRRTPSDIIWHESIHLDARDVGRVAGIPVTKPHRTILDLGAILDVTGVTVVLDDLLRRRLVSRATLLRRLEELGPHRRGAATVRRALDRRPDTSATPESVLETEFDLLLRRYGLPAPVRQLVVHDDDGFVARLDYAYEDLRIDIEVDGARWHSSESARARDRARDERLRRLGWLVLRFRAADIRQRPSWVAEQVRLAVFERAGLADPRR